MRRRQRALHGRLSAEARKGVYARRTQESALHPNTVTLTGRVLESRIESYNVRAQSTRLQCCYEANKVWSG